MVLWFVPIVAVGQFPSYFVAVYVIGFMAAITLGLIAWYNSKRPAGWENAERPDFVPKIKPDTPAETGEKQE